MHYKRYTDEELQAALTTAEAFHRAIFNQMVCAPDTDHCWKFLCDLEWEMQAMEAELIRRALPAEIEVA